MELKQIKVLFHNYVIHNIERAISLFRGLKTILLCGLILYLGYTDNIDRNILFLCVFFLAAILTLKETISSETKQLRNEIIKMRRGA